MRFGDLPRAPLDSGPLVSTGFTERGQIGLLSPAHIGAPSLNE
jgi:hypothetical protein